MKKDERTMGGGGGVVEFPASELAITTGYSISPAASEWRVQRKVLFVHVLKSCVHL